MKMLYGTCVSILVAIILILSYCLYRCNRLPCASYRKKGIQALIRQTARWTAASQQDKSPMISLLHANYGAGYLQALELIATENEINEFASLQKLRLKVYSTQDKAAQRVFAACPDFLGKDIDRDLVMIGINAKDDSTPN